MINKKVTAWVGLAVLSSVLSVSYADNYYASVKVSSNQDKAKEMDTSARPGIGSFVKGSDKKDRSSDHPKIHESIPSLSKKLMDQSSCSTSQCNLLSRLDCRNI